MKGNQQELLLSLGPAWLREHPWNQQILVLCNLVGVGILSLALETFLTDAQLPAGAWG